MTIKSFYILNSLGKILFEHHYQTFNFSKSLIEYFCNYANLHGNLSLSQSKNTVKPVIDVPRFESTLIWLCRDQVYLVVRVDSDVPPLMALTFLERFHSISLSYFSVSSLTEANVKENLTVIFEVITTLLDGGVPFVTDENLLTEIVKPVDVLSKVVSQVTGVVSAPDTPTPSSQLSTTPWRKFNPRYTSNEIYLDITESLDLIIERNGNVVPGGGVNGVVKCTSKLSGTPDVEVRFMGFGGSKTGWEEVGVHRCVRYSKWEREKALSFVPPDGTFELMSYRAPVASAQVLPIFLRPRITFSQDSGPLILDQPFVFQVSILTHMLPTSSLRYSIQQARLISPYQPEPLSMLSIMYRCQYICRMIRM
ncbi:Mu homology domain-containing protein [Paraphysoderma sedebokerense]|nr:Mu homology domain-containing protein [Paraphysoderma sedebokerense]